MRTMIDEYTTLKMFGYTSEKWKAQSNKPIVAICDGCGKSRVVKKYAYHDLCMPCSKKGWNPREETRRAMREAWKTRAPITEETRQRMSVAQSGKNNPFYGVRRCGKDNPRWKGGAAEWRTTLHGSQAYKNWRAAVFERDTYACQMCGDAHGGNLQAHHIKPVSEHKNDLLIFDIDNGVTLCKDCHTSIRRKEHDFIGYFETIVETRRNDL